MELRKRRGLMITLVLVTVGIPTSSSRSDCCFMPSHRRPTGRLAGMPSTPLLSRACCTSSVSSSPPPSAARRVRRPHRGDVPHLVVTGRSRLALYLARIPAGLAIIVPLVAIGFAIVCAVCVFAAPTRSIQRRERARRLSRTGLESWAADHPNESSAASTQRAVVLTGRGARSRPIGGGPTAPRSLRSAADPKPTERPGAVRPRRPDREPNYSDYSRLFRSPSASLMIKSGLWIELEAVIGFFVGLGLGSLIGQRTVAVIMMIVLEIVLTPILSRRTSRTSRTCNAPSSGSPPPAWNLACSPCSVVAAAVPVASGNPAATGIDDGCRLRHRRLARGLDRPRRLANDDPRRLNAAAPHRWLVTSAGWGRVRSRPTTSSWARARWAWRSPTALIDHADVHVTLVDRRHAAGGHWQDAYPFVQLHQDRCSTASRRQFSVRVRCSSKVPNRAPATAATGGDPALLRRHPVSALRRIGPCHLSRRE